jgi:hypothetical protein
VICEIGTNIYEFFFPGAATVATNNREGPNLLVRTFWWAARVSIPVP